MQAAAVGNGALAFDFLFERQGAFFMVFARTDGCDESTEACWQAVRTEEGHAWQAIWLHKAGAVAS